MQSLGATVGLKVASRTQAPVFVAAGGAATVAAKPVVSAPTIAVADQSKAAQAAVTQPALTMRLQDLKMIEPEVAGKISAMPFVAPDGVARSQLTSPILQGELTDSAVLEDPKDPAKKYFLMGYAVSEESTTSGRRFAVRMLAKAQGWELSLTLNKLAPDVVVRANPGIQELTHGISLLLRYKQRINGVMATFGEMPFTSTTVEGGTVRASMTIENLPKRDEIYEALTDKDFEATLVVRRAARVAVLAPQPPQNDIPTGIYYIQAPAAMRLAEKGISIQDITKPAPAPPPTPLYRETDRVVDLPLRFTFDGTLHGYIFEGLGTIVPGASSGLQRRQISWKGRSHSYYQDDRSRNIIYYLPDTFKIARRPDAPHRPLILASFNAKDGVRENMEVAVTYCAVPVVNRERLTAALPAIKALVPPEILATVPIQLEPLLPDPAQIRLKLAFPGSDTSAGPFEKREQAAVDLRAGIVDKLIGLSLDEFRGLFDAMFSEGQLMFTGGVAFQFGDIGEEIPFQLRIYDTAEPLVSWTQAVDGDATSIVLTNPIESILRVRHVDAIAVDAAGPGVHPLELVGGTLPLDIPPSGTARFRLPRGAGLTTVDLDLSDVQAVPSKDAIFNLILDPSTRAEFLRPITVVTFAETFAAAPDAPRHQVMLVVVDFDDGTTVKLTPTQLEVPVRVPVPVVGFVLGTEMRQIYRYKVTVVRLDGVTSDAEWKTGESGILPVIL